MEQLTEPVVRTRLAFVAQSVIRTMAAPLSAPSAQTKPTDASNELVSDLRWTTFQSLPAACAAEARISA